MKTNSITAGLLLAFVAMAAYSCSNSSAPSEEPASDDIEVTINLNQKDYEPLPSPLTSFVAILDTTQTKTVFDYQSWVLKEVWEEGDVIALSPGAFGKAITGYYTALTGGSKTTTFFSDSPIQYYYPSYPVVGVYYPGDRIACDDEFVMFNYLSQVQNSSSPMAHLSRYRTLRQLYSIEYSAIWDYTPAVSFAGGLQSACMHFALSGASFSKPAKVELECSRAVFYQTNDIVGSTCYSDGGSVAPTPVNRLSINLEGYGDVSQLDVFMMMSCRSVQLQTGDILTVKVKCEDGVWSSSLTMTSDMTLPGGNCHNLVISKDWQLKERGEESALLKYNLPGVYDLSDPAQPLPLYSASEYDPVTYSNSGNVYATHIFNLSSPYSLSMELTIPSLEENAQGSISLLFHGLWGEDKTTAVSVKIITLDDGLVYLKSEDGSKAYIMMID